MVCDGDDILGCLVGSRRKGGRQGGSYASYPNGTVSLLYLIAGKNAKNIIQVGFCRAGKENSMVRVFSSQQVAEAK